MELRFFEDPDTGMPHIYNHGVSEEEVRQVLAHPGEDRKSTNDSRIAAGQTESGRYLRVFYVPDAEGDGVYIVTAYELRGNDLKAYRRRKRRRRK